MPLLYPYHFCPLSCPSLHEMSPWYLILMRLLSFPILLCSSISWHCSPTYTHMSLVCVCMCVYHTYVFVYVYIYTENEISISSNIYPLTFTVTLFAIGKSRKWPRCLLRDEWIKKILDNFDNIDEPGEYYVKKKKDRKTVFV